MAASQEPCKLFSIDTLQVLKIASQDQRAVIKTPDGKMQILNVGDNIGDRAKVIEITTGRVVIEETKGKNPERVIIRLENGKQHVERLTRVGETQPPAYSTKTSQEPQAQKSAMQEKQPGENNKKKADKESKEKTNKKAKKKNQNNRQEKSGR